MKVDAAAAMASVLRNLRKFPPLAEAILKNRRGAFAPFHGLIAAGLPPEAGNWIIASHDDAVNKIHILKYISYRLVVRPGMSLLSLAQTGRLLATGGAVPDPARAFEEW
ncbi:hypothetical protein [Mesorhizobium retamae]|uniref:Uncharacterized protein n=1 Tax=Mesorhizobium retamae TaxID=2912854 RepID=A0ABS9QEZ1_9HYPH|nr:hypothetical protein [Mesorhizobium sp. IRAMC:0171]MCG7505988.1 hypothetical protein [Mesorhizobium sp. IRAMC:0171]